MRTIQFAGVLAVAISTLLSGTAVANEGAFNYRYRMDLGSVASPPQLPQDSVALAPRAFAAMKPGSSWSFDFASLLSVSGISPGDVTLAVSSATAAPSWFKITGTNVSMTNAQEGVYDIKVSASAGSMSAEKTYRVEVVTDALLVKQIEMYDNLACAVLLDDSAKCWGGGFYGALGNGSQTDSLSPVQVTGLTSGVRKIGVSVSRACALMKDGTVKCWGWNGAGGLGNGTNVDSPLPQTVPGITNAKDLEVSQGATCVILSDDTVKCWGANTVGQIGAGDTDTRLSPVVPAQIPETLASITGGLAHTCGIGLDGTAWCWGAINNQNGQLGSGQQGGSLVATKVMLPTPVRAIKAGGNLSCAIGPAGVAHCWGSNTNNGSLGTGAVSPSTSSVPLAVANVGQVKDIHAGIGFGCALKINGHVACWGVGSNGRLGNGSTATGPQLIPTEIVGLDDVVSITGNSSGVCAVKSTGVALCWGQNFKGILGDKTAVDRSAPVIVRK